QCSSRCDSGVQTRERLCNSPTPQHGGKSCSGPHIQTRDCNSQPFDGQWSAWTPWGHCSVSCGAGLQSRYRFCSSPRPSGSGLPCTGPHHEDQVCIIAPCDGGWGQWSHWTECTKSCGGGVRSRRRNCDSPSPEGEGNYCEGLGSKCQSVPGCHVDGGWSQWGAWTECSLSCGGGVKFRRRLCDNPSPQSGGRGCLGDAEQQRDCNTHLCTVGPWLPWSQWSECSVSCGGGQQYRSRLCSLPACSGRQSKICNTHVFDGGWSRWSPWSRCDKRCGGGRSIRTRSCSSPPPKNGGKKCAGEKNQVKPCNTKPCGESDLPRPAFGSSLFQHMAVYLQECVFSLCR
uniref:PROP n=1 Tax=Maylandia zebra TaxID=106582 RepID=A0A3P9CEY4_9CICH